MKYTAIALLLVMFVAGGCMPLPTLPEPPPVKATAEKDAAPPPPPVRAEDINDSNAHAKAKALQAELDRELNDGAAEAPPVKVRP